MNYILIAFIIIIIIAIGGIIYVLFQDYSQKPIDGKLSEWSEWSACDKTCGTGTQSRTRSYTPPQFGGVNPNGYENLLENQPCNTNPCPIDGKLSEWSNWSYDTPCGWGTKSRTRSYTPPQFGGANPTDYNKLIETLKIWRPECLINDGIILSNTTILYDTILFSKNKTFRLEFNRSNGVIKIRQKNIDNSWRDLWASGKNNTGGLTQLIMNTDGNLIIKDKNNIILWESQTADNPGAYAELTDDGKFIIRNAAKIIKIIYEKSTFVNKIYNRYLEIINY